MSAREYQESMLKIIGKTDCSLSDLARATGRSRDAIRPVLYGLKHRGGKNIYYPTVEAAKMLYMEFQDEEK